MKLVSMAKTVKEKQKEATPWDEREAEDIEDYPYGLAITLSHEELQKLGFARGELDAGMVLDLVGKAQITNVDARQVNGVKRFSASMQIQQLGVSIDTKEDERADNLFGVRP